MTLPVLTFYFWVRSESRENRRPQNVTAQLAGNIVCVALHLRSSRVYVLLVCLTVFCMARVVTTNGQFLYSVKQLILPLQLNLIRRKHRRRIYSALVDGRVSKVLLFYGLNIRLGYRNLTISVRGKCESRRRLWIVVFPSDHMRMWVEGRRVI